MTAHITARRASAAAIWAPRLSSALAFALALALQLAMPARGGGEDALAGELQHPTEVDRRHEMQGSAHRPGPHDLPFGERPLDVGRRGGCRAQADRPECPAKVLRLHREHVGHHVDGGAQRLAGDALRGETQPCELPPVGGEGARHAITGRAKRDVR